MPAYDMVLKDSRWNAESVATDVKVGVNPFETVSAQIHRVTSPDFDLWLIGGHPDFDAVKQSEQIYAPTRDAYLFFSQAALQMCDHLDWIPDVVHVHDWHTGFIPVLMREGMNSVWDKVGSVFTIHNLAYQGEFGLDTLDEVGLPHCLFNMHQLETYGNVNFLKSGCVFADQVNTVSPTYAQEIQTAQYGCRLEGLMAHLASQKRLRGILNGIDLEFFDPSTDPAIPAKFDVMDKSGKQVCKQRLAKELNLSTGDGPLFGVVSRLSEQKGFDLIIAGLSRMLELGTGDPWAADQLRSWMALAPGRVSFVERFDADLAQCIYAGSDVFLMPSSFEPCGLGQMIAMRYGSIPLARRTGGLADTVFDRQNGFVFEERTVSAYLDAVVRATEVYAEPSAWAALVDQAMRADFSWSRSAARYEAMYEDARAGKSANGANPKSTVVRKKEALSGAKTS
jgi:starch synthase